MIIVLQMCAI